MVIPASFRFAPVIGCLLACCSTAEAQQSSSQPEVAPALPVLKVNATRLDVPAFDVPAAVSVVKISPNSTGTPGVNLSESLVGVPSILARDRQNYAQDEQISIRGFGARATFGVRSIRLYVDGIPATLPDGQGQVSHFNFDSADRVEILRGPFSVLYGNAAGGVVQVWSADGTPQPQTTLGVNAGSNDSFRYSADTRGTIGPVDYNVAGSEFLSGGYREHSRVHRESDNAKFGIDLADGKKITLVFNRLYQPISQDELGLTRPQLDADPRQANPAAIQFNTRKSIEQNQGGAIYEQSLGEDDHVRVMLYDGQRSILQFQAIPVAVQRNPLQSGAVVDLDTQFGGADARWTHDGELFAGRYEFVLGASGDYQRQHRLGYTNFAGDVLGIIGALRRNENDNVTSADQYAQWYWHFADAWVLLFGARHDDVRFAEHDFYITPQNPNDSGGVNYTATTPVLGLQFRPNSTTRVYVSAGKGFETPSYNELGYRSDGLPGLAFNLRPALSRNYEVGFKWQITPALEWDTDVFRSDTHNELAIDTNENGRSTYQNVGDTRRQGLESSLTGALADEWHITAGFTHMQARFRSAFLTCFSTPCPIPNIRIPAGTRIPGVPDDFGSLRLQHGKDLGWREGIDFTGIGSVTVNDNATQQAAGYSLIGLDAGYAFRITGRTLLDLSARIDNVANRRYIGSVIVNDSNGRYFEPGPDRTYMFGARLVF
ncbi:TonB-dependent receptor [Dyella sp. 2HG41-7]|uniref:TonB-dependent receptor family protein n=1 Tax=Dyella sp. 2HG41-7 TaxID=2883239 RepID=UPI0021043B96|nr:TonB-dependent receptor [Dyella sp. 2HG41-7]